MNIYKSNNLPLDQNKYSLLYSELNSYFTPFNLISEELTNNLLIEKNVNTSISTIIDNLEEMYENREQIEMAIKYERMTKPHVIATEEFLNGKLFFKNPSKK